MFIDSHAHLFNENYGDDLDEVIRRARNSGVEYMIIPATNMSTAEEILITTEKYEFIYGAVGVHPHDTKDWDDGILIRLEEMTKGKKIIAIGEIGLDYYYDFSPKEKQIAAFRGQIELALKLNLPVIIHNRDSDEDMIEIIRSYAGSGLKAQFHCFSGTLELARELIKMHHYVSFTGNITFKKFNDLREAASKITLEHILLETDSPYMSPEPFRGKKNEPSRIELIAKKLADLHGVSVEDIGRITSYNVFKLFGIGAKPKTSYTYKIGDSLYINVTNRCNAGCIFCGRKDEAVISGYNLAMSKQEEPAADVYIKEIGNPAAYKEIVFCGYGEPTIRWDVVKEIASYVKANGGTTRLNTNGHANVINMRDITGEMKGLIDTVSISMNSIDAEEYAEIMQVDKRYYFEMLDFANKLMSHSIKVVMTIVLYNDIEIEKAKAFVAENIGAEFRVREYF